jgi:hypothetical protein
LRRVKALEYSANSGSKNFDYYILFRLLEKHYTFCPQCAQLELARNPERTEWAVLKIEGEHCYVWLLLGDFLYANICIQHCGQAYIKFWIARSP